MLIAIRDHFKVEDQGAIGYLGYSKEDRLQLAMESRLVGCKACGYQAPRVITKSANGEILETPAEQMGTLIIRRPPAGGNHDDSNNYTFQAVALIVIAIAAIILNHYL